MSHLERQRKEREKRTFARKGKEDLDFEKQKEKANDMMIHFPKNPYNFRYFVRMMKQTKKKWEKKNKQNIKLGMRSFQTNKQQTLVEKQKKKK